MKICLYSPYIPKHFGGGEKYLLDCASLLSKKHEVSIAFSTSYSDLNFDARASKTKYEEYFGIDLSQLHFIKSPLGTSTNFLEKLWWTKQWDVLYYLTDGSLFFSLAKKNILHIQVPLMLDKSSFIEQLKLKNWQVKNTNSYFTKKVIEKSWETKVDLVHWPLIEEKSKKQSFDSAQDDKAESETKKKVILNVGRFFRQLHSKRQDVLVDIFRQLVTDNAQLMTGWKLVFIGAVEDQTYFDEVKAKAEGLPIEFYTDLNRQELETWYQQASIYWHATGFEVNQEEHPEMVEHFGISTVEAMSYGCVPIVINKGGQKEILDDDLKNLLWETKQECVDKTTKIIKNDEFRIKNGQLASERAQIFGQDRFENQLNSMLYGSSALPLYGSPKVSAVIPTYNGKELLEENLPAVLESLREGDELVIVDDASSDGTEEWLEGYKLQATSLKKIGFKIIKNKENLRFAAAVNRGVEEATGDLILLLNNDVRPHKDVLTHLVPYFLTISNQQPATSPFAVGCLEQEKDSQGNEVKGGKNTLRFQRGMFIHNRADNFSSGETAWVSGGSGLFDRNKWLELGGFDSLFYPAYWEDIDLSFRARQKGWQVLFEEKAIVEHLHETTNDSVFGQKRIEVMSWKNAEKFAWKNGNWWQKLQFLLWRPYWIWKRNQL